ncbi:MAG: hypothetical protein K9J17_18445 [Flavobacteriales bacterium]|nr:hypothetical protein [Flavobacteriales bacterium]
MQENMNYLEALGIAAMEPAISINELLSFGEMNQRTYGICLENGLLNTQQLIAFYRKHGDFKSLRHCGAIGSHILVSLCKKYVGLKSCELQMTDGAVDFDRLRNAKTALDNGHLDVLIILGKTDGSRPGANTPIRGRIGWCRNEY